MAEMQGKTSPIVVIAAVSVIIFSAVGVGVMTGVIPSSRSSEQQVKPPEPQARAPEQHAKPQEPVPAAAPAAAPADKPRPPQKAASAPKKPSEPTRVAVAEPTRVAATEPERSAPEPAKAAPRVCENCGTVQSVNLVKQEGEGTGLGAVAGGVVGGLLGNQIGQGRGRTAATVIGAGAGAYAGHQTEKHVKSTQHYNVAVRMDDGSSRTFTYENEPGLRAGDKVKVVEGKLVMN